MRGRAFDEAARAVLADVKNAQLVPLEFEPNPANFAADGYHPSEQGYAEFGREMADRLLRARSAVTR